MSEVQARLRDEITALKSQLAAYRGIVNQVLAVVLDEPNLEADYNLPPPIEMMPPNGSVDALKIRNWWLKVVEGYERPNTLDHSTHCQRRSGCWECGLCSDCGRYVGAGE